MILASAKNIERYTAQGVWGAVSLDVLLQRQAEAQPDRLALRDPANRAEFATGPVRALTWRQSWLVARELAATLKTCGLAPGDIVGIQLPPIVEAPLILLACWHAGLIAAPLPVPWRANEISKALTRVGARALVTWDEPGNPQRFDDLRQAGANIGSIRAVLAFGEAQSDGVVALNPVIDEALEQPSDDDELAATDDAPNNPNAAATVTWDVSQSTDADAASLRSHNEWIAAGIATMLGAGLRDQPTIVCPYPLNALVPIGALMVPWLMNGGTLVLHRPFDLDVICDQLTETPAQFTCLPPAMAAQLIREIETRDLSGALDVLAVQWKNENPRPIISDTSTDGPPHRIDIVNLAEIALIVGEHASGDDSMHTLPLAGAQAGTGPVMCEICLAPADQAEAGGDAPEAERVAIRSPMAPSAWLTQRNDNTASGFAATANADGFVETGLFASRRGDSGCRLTQNPDRLVRHGGLALSLSELDELYKSHQSIADAAALTQPDDTMGQRLIAAIIPDGDDNGAQITLPDFTAHLRALGVAAYKLPDRLLIVDEIPRDDQGNIERACTLGKHG